MWEISLSLQIEAFIWSVFLGAVFCLAFDLLNKFGEEFISSKALVFVLDILFFVTIGFVDFCFFLAFCNGEIRGYVFVGEIIGFYFCRKTLARIYIPVLLIAFGGVKRLCRGVCSRLFAPIHSFFEKIGKKALKISQKTLFFIKKGLKKPKRLVYTKEKCPKVNKREDEKSGFQDKG